jgi:hypothetical protein
VTVLAEASVISWEDWAIPLLAVFVGAAITFWVEWWFRSQERTKSDAARAIERRRVVYADAAAVLFTYLDHYRDLATEGRSESPYSNAEANLVEMRLRIDGTQRVWQSFQAATTAAVAFHTRTTEVQSLEGARDRLDPRGRTEEEHHADHLDAVEQINAARVRVNEALLRFDGEVHTFRRVMLDELGETKLLDWPDPGS